MNVYRHKTRGHPSIKQLLAFLLTLIVLVSTTPPDLAKADTIEHTHIWATTYDSTNHWEYCTVCGEKRNVTAHVFTDHWNYGYENCAADNYSRRICNCGYSYIYHKPHSKTYIAESHTYWERVHVNKCSSCGDWLSRSGCYNENGAINCKNPGKCLVCGGSWPTGRHYIDNGICPTCKTTFYRISEPQVSYNDDFTHAYVKYIFYPANSSVIPVDTQTNYSSCTNGGMSSHGSITKNSDGTYTINLDVIISSSREKALVGWIYNNVAVNGVTCFVNTNPITVWRDHQAPVQNDVVQKDQASANGWATIKQLTLSGTENLSDIVYLTVSDKLTGEKYVTDAAVSVVDGKYSYTCTPSIEGDINGRTYVVTAKDRIGNTSTKEFVTSKTDGSAPQLKNGTSLTYTDWTNTAKDISLSFFDFGSGGVEASFDNQTDYKPLTKNGEYYIWNHSFGNQVGTTEHTIYVKDALSNATSYKLTVGNTDSNVYSISYNLNGGSLSGQKTNYTVADSFTLPQPTKTGYTFTGWTGSNGTTPQKTVTVNKGTRGNLSYTANWTQINTINYNIETVYPSWAEDKTHVGGTINKTSEVVSGNNTPVGATAANDSCFVFDGWYSSSGELITKDATIKPLNCNAEEKGGFIYPSYRGSSIYDASTDTYMVTTDVSPEEGTAKETWGSGVHHIGAEIPWNNWYIAEFEVWSPIDAECVIDINNWGPNGHSWNGNDNDNAETRFYKQNGNNPIFPLKANTWKKIVIGYQNSSDNNINHESLWDQHTINLRYNKSLGNQTFKIRNYKAAISPTLVKELDTFTARFKPWEHTVAYDANDGTGVPESFQKCFLNSRWISSTIPTRTGYTFKSWNTKKDGTGTTYNPGQQYLFDQDGGTVTLYAQWMVNTYTNKLNHWACGMKYGEGNNGYKNCFLIRDTPYTKNYGETYVMDDSWLIKIPNGYYPTRTTGFFTFASNGTTNGFISRGFGYKFTQNDNNSYENLYHELYYRPYDYSITYNLNGGTNNSSNPSTYNVLYGVSLKAPTRAGYTFTGWYDEDGNQVTGINEGCNATFSSADDLYAKLAARTTGNRTLTAHWSYNPVKVKVPQVLTGDSAGKSQFRVKCDDLKAGNIKVAVPNSFLYKQTGKADVTATITAKSGNNIITPTNKVCVYNITTKNGLSAGCWSGSFNIGLTLIKE